MATKTKSRKSQPAKARYIGKPAGTIQERVQVDNACLTPRVLIELRLY